MTSPNSARLLPRLAVLALTVVGMAEQAPAASLNTSLEELSQRIHDYLTSHGLQHVNVGTFSGPPGTGAGVALRSELVKQLEEDGLEVTKRARTEVRGEFAANLDPEGPPAVGIRVKLVDHRGTELVDFQYRPDDVDNVDDVARLLSPTVDLTVKTEQAAPVLAEVFAERDEQLRESLTEPTFHQVSSSIFTASADSPYRIELLLRDGSGLTPVPLENFEGRAFVDLPEGREYVVRLYNESDVDVGVKLMIDGVNSLELSEIEDYRNLGMWIIKAKSRGTIDGWHVRNDRSLGFRVVDAEDSEAARLERDQGDIGTITASFFPAWTGDHVPKEELIGRTKGTFGTAAGDEHESNYVENRRHFGRTLLVALSARYEKPDPPANLPGGLAQLNK